MAPAFFMYNNSFIATVGRLCDSVCEKCGRTKLANIGASNQSVTCTIRFAVHTNYVTQIWQGQNISIFT